MENSNNSKIIVDIITKLKEIDVDVETMQYILEATGMDEQILSQLINTADQTTLDYFLETREINNLGKIKKETLIKIEVIYSDKPHGEPSKYHNTVKTLSGKTKEEIFMEFYSINNSLRYCNGSYYSFKNPEIQKDYSNWYTALEESTKFEMFYKGGIVD